MKNLVLILSLFAVVNAFASECPEWNENTQYTGGDDVCYNGEEYEVVDDVQGVIYGADYCPYGCAFSHFWQPTDSCDCGGAGYDIEYPQDCGPGDSMRVDGKIFLHPYNSDTARAGKLYFKFNTGPADYISFEIEVPPTLNPTPQRYSFDDLAFRTDADIYSSGTVVCDTLQAQYHIFSKSIHSEDIRCDSIKTRELWVTENFFPDFVFKPGYQLKPLKEVEKFIKEHKHLPGIPSEKEVKEKGFSVGKMQTKLLEKIEEMTLRMIQMQKRIDELEKNQKQAEQ